MQDAEQAEDPSRVTLVDDPAEQHGGEDTACGDAGGYEAEAPAGCSQIVLLSAEETGLRHPHEVADGESVVNRHRG